APSMTRQAKPITHPRAARIHPILSARYLTSAIGPTFPTMRSRSSAVDDTSPWGPLPMSHRRRAAKDRGRGSLARGTEHELLGGGHRSASTARERSEKRWTAARRATVDVDH